HKERGPALPDPSVVHETGSAEPGKPELVGPSPCLRCLACGHGGLLRVAGVEPPKGAHDAPGTGSAPPLPLGFLCLPGFLLCPPGFGRRHLPLLRVLLRQAAVSFTPALPFPGCPAASMPRGRSFRFRRPPRTARAEGRGPRAARSAWRAPEPPADRRRRAGRRRPSGWARRRRRCP